jgi:hypothetical protein
MSPFTMALNGVGKTLLKRFNEPPSRSTFNPWVKIWRYVDLAFAVPSPRLENIKLMAINNDLEFGLVIPDS